MTVPTVGTEHVEFDHGDVVQVVAKYHSSPWPEVGEQGWVTAPPEWADPVRVPRFVYVAFPSTGMVPFPCYRTEIRHVSVSPETKENS